VVLNYTTAYTTFGIKASISPGVPNNEGSFRPVKVSAPEGCILNAVRPAPLAARHIIGHLAPIALFGALAQVVPDRVMAEGAAAIWITQTRGYDTHGRAFTFFQTSAGGTGARPEKDGLDNTSFPSGVAGVPVEVIESLTPLVVHERAIRPDSAGPGRFRGGLGQSMRLGIRSNQPWTLAALFDRIRFAPVGYRGGGPGACGEFVLSDGSRPDPKIQQTLDAATEVHMKLPGGGGFWPPFERLPKDVLRDVVEGKVSIEAAARDYGVVIACRTPPGDLVAMPADYEIDERATAALRGQAPDASERMFASAAAGAQRTNDGG
jgi:N-methylhydantoinase B